MSLPCLVCASQLPLALGLVVRLGGGSGTALAVAVHHSLVDFHGLQTFVAHWAAAYNKRLLKQQGQLPQQHEQVRMQVLPSSGLGGDKADAKEQQGKAGAPTVVAVAAAGAWGQADAHSTVQLADTSTTAVAAAAAAAKDTASSPLVQVSSHTAATTATASPGSSDAPTTTSINATATCSSSSPGGGPLLQVPPCRRRPVLRGALLDGQASDAPLPPGVPPVDSETVPATPLVMLGIGLYFLWHTAIWGGGLQVGKRAGRRWPGLPFQA